MTLGELRAQFLARLNRDDCTAELADSFISEGLLRIGREVRARFMETTLAVDTAADVSAFPIPADYAETIDVIANGWPLTRKSYREMLRLNVAGTACPSIYARQGSTIFVRGIVPAGGELSLIYHAKPAALVADGDTNTVTLNASDLLLYAALVPAADHFQQDKLAEWEARYALVKGELATEVSQEEAVGGSQVVEPMYYDPGT